jgi:hypothetical protein
MSSQKYYELLKLSVMSQPFRRLQLIFIFPTTSLDDLVWNWRTTSKPSKRDVEKKTFQLKKFIAMTSYVECSRVTSSLWKMMME